MTVHRSSQLIGIQGLCSLLVVLFQKAIVHFSLGNGDEVSAAWQVFQCLVEGCAKTFHSPADRRKHLWDQHCYPREFNYHLMHLGKHQGQYGPRKETHHLVPGILESMEARVHDAQSKGQQHQVSTTESGKATQSSMHMYVQESGQSLETLEKRPGGDSAMDIDDLAHGLSRLATASRNMSHVPRSITFGRRGK